ncbi:hypothetical protein IE81DRAFT_323510 [Ceraceosorus guamensis]|uniref:PX domain-containing protein n=1 Tax=Ceraceosorus guamensis TaxID=1522189 RepID=A0A316VZQ6_9BASI|nr:hypothetical protein IE81DRAFT_323510 [Ceraceosorus guamensis]PWN42358.1 hypothetical protein IE81DRAFT_323510 [Ceraceosorus guamensis]
MSTTEADGSRVAGNGGLDSTLGVQDKRSAHAAQPVVTSSSGTEEDDEDPFVYQSSGSHADDGAYDIPDAPLEPEGSSADTAGAESAPGADERPPATPDKPIPAPPHAANRAKQIPHHTQSASRDALDDGENSASMWGGKPHVESQSRPQERAHANHDAPSDSYDAPANKAPDDGDASLSASTVAPVKSGLPSWDEAPSSSSKKGTQAEPHATLPPGSHGHVHVTDALKSSDGGPSTFIVYVISLPALGISAKRRYSEFEAFRAALVALHPTRIVPPLPPKHSLGDYAAKQGKAKEDATIIARRRRMLGSFLMRCAKDPVIGKDEVLRRFCDGRESWHEISTTPPVAILPKSNLRAPVRDPADPNASSAYAALPIPSAATPLRNPNGRFADSEAFTNRWAAHVGGSLERSNRRVARRWQESSSDYAELGAVLNGFSLGESGDLAVAIERTGQAADGTFMSIGEMLQEWESTFTEPLSEYAQYGVILQKLLKWRHLKHLQFELAEEAVESKRQQLDDLERVEAHSTRVTAALDAGNRNVWDEGSLGPNSTAAPVQSRAGVWDSVNAKSMRKSVFGAAAEEDEEAAPRTDANHANSNAHGDADEWVDGAAPSQPGSSLSGASTRSDPTAHSTAGKAAAAGAPSAKTAMSNPAAVRAAAPPRRTGGFLGALSHTLNSVLDVDPESTRRSNISKLRSSIAELDEALSLTADDLRFATSAIQQSLDGFQRDKVNDLRRMFISYAKFHREFCRVNRQNWEEAKKQIDSVQAESAMPEANLVKAHDRS